MKATNKKYAHTPGPWELRNDGIIWARRGLAPTYICQPKTRTHEGKANAKLIAALPKILSALISAVQKMKNEGLDTSAEVNTIIESTTLSNPGD